MRPLRQGEKLFQEDELRFETILGYFRIEGNKRRAMMIILAQTGFGRYRRIVQESGTDNEALDLQVVDFNFGDLFEVNDVLISNPRPSLPQKHHVSMIMVPIALNCATALTAGVEVGGFWSALEENVVIEKKIVSGETFYTALPRAYGNIMRDGSYQNSVAFTIRSIKSGETCGIVLALLDREKFGVAIVHDLKEQDFRHRGFFDRWHESSEVPESQDLTQDVISYKLKDGTYLFLGCAGQEKFDQVHPTKLPETLKPPPKVQLRVGIVK
jgi:hypothetical protein